MTVSLAQGNSDDLDSVMAVMSAAFAERYGEAWTRSQCAGILPMTGVKLVLARNSGGKVVGFSLYRTVVDDARDKPDPVGFLGVDEPACEQQLERA